MTFLEPMTKKKYSLDLNNFPVWPEFNWIEFEVDNSIEAVKKLHIINKNAFNTICHDLENKISKLRDENKTLNVQELEQYTHHLYGLEEQIILELNNVQSSSIIIYSFAIFENKLKMISEKVQRDFKFVLSARKSDSYTSDYWKILKSFTKLKTNTVEKYFTPIKCQMILRNIIIHQNSIATKNQYKAIHKVPGLTFNEFEEQYYLVNIENIFIEQLVEKIEIFFQELLSIIKLETNERLRNVI